MHIDDGVEKCFQSMNLEKLIFISKNWLDDAKVGCEAPSKLRELTYFEIDLEQESDEFESSFEWHELNEE
jgi:hypothetical protein